MTVHSKNVHIVNSLSFDAEVLAAEGPVLVDFTATWCGPCKQLAPIVERIADESVGELKVVKVDIDDAPDVAARYGVRAVPTVIAFHRGQKIGQHLGVASRAKLLALVDAARRAEPRLTA